MRQPTAQVTDEYVGGAKQFVRQTGLGDEVAHQDEQRNDGQRVGKAGFVHDLRRTGQGRLPAAHHAHAGDADHTHGKSQRHPQQGQHEDGGEAQKRLGHLRTLAVQLTAWPLRRDRRQSAWSADPGARGR